MSNATRIVTIADLGAAIRRERRRQGLTQTDLADLCGVSLSFVSNVENGKRTAEVGRILTLVQTLGMDLFVERRGE